MSGLVLLAACHGPAFVLKGGSSCGATATGNAGPASVVWTNELGRSGVPHAIGVGPGGAVAVAGMTSGIPRRAFVATFDAHGHLRWLREFAGHATFSGVAIGADGSVAVDATFREQIELAGQSIAPPIGEEDVFIAKWSPTGDAQWMRAVQGKYADEAGPLVIDDAGDVHFAARIAGDPISLGATKVSDMVLATLSGKDGAVLGATSWVGAKPTSLAIDRTAASGRGLVLAGFFRDELHLGYDAAQNERVLKPGYGRGGGAFVMKLRSLSDVAWAETAVSVHEYVDWYQAEPSVAVSPRGRIAVVANDHDARRTTLIGTWDQAGKRGWERCFSTAGGDSNATAIAFDEGENLSIAGNFQEGASYVDQGGPLFLVRYSATGDLLDSSVRFRSNKISPGAVAIDTLGRAIWIGADFHGKSDEQAPDDVIVQAFGRRLD